MKKFIILSLTLCLGIILGACSSSETAKDKEDSNKVSANEDKDSNSKTENEDVQKNENTQGNEIIKDDENMRVKNIFSNEKLNIKGTTGPMKYEINGIDLAEVEPKNEKSASFFNAKVGEKVNTIIIKMSAENTSEKDVDFFLGMSKIITNTKEQLEPETLSSNAVEGEYLGKVKSEGYSTYILKKSSLKDLKTIEIRIEAPRNSNFDSIGKDVKHTIKVNN
ncbi:MULTISPECIES: hypothetical protein [Bacillus subtilis group]|uniref:hypothetical protein n=1 Tax=Bacillus TaxID=1386 RepID=UPI000BBCFF98|nr:MULTISPECIES: hypothetical protein [Bacillus subtilis group]QAS14957.1 hypothetical protein EQJ69_03200 [Bacillus licheniformis]QEO05783.1 hypothetical protein FLQ07_09465 [Bacillus paralicheniformis]